MVRGMLGAGGVVEVVQTSGEEAGATRDRRVACTRAHPGRGYRFRNEWHYLVAAA